MKKLPIETIKTWIILALIFSIIGFVGGWQAHDHVTIQDAIHAQASKN